jgi:hypothetical protein
MGKKNYPPKFEGGLSMEKEKKYKTPQGTVVLVILYVLLIIALWGSAYLTMLARGATG